MFEKDEDKPSGDGGPVVVDRGEFLQGKEGEPYCSPEGKCCGLPSGYCTSDKQCHSSAAKCPKIK